MRKSRAVKYIVVHHSLTADSKTLSWAAIRRYHTKDRGWRDIGYHVGIELVGTSYETVVGRPWTQVGAHAPGRNADSLGVCLVGNFDKSPPGRALWAAAVRLVRWLALYHGVPVDRVIGHREATKGRHCPGKYFDLDKFRAELAKAR
jgi:hypothetical protein